MERSIDREKVIKGIQECNLNGGLIGNCPYKGILALLKEQEIVLCKDCTWNSGTPHNPICQKDYGARHSHWFCADGER